MWRLNWLLAFTTGLRQGERLGLTMDELTTLNGRRALVIDHQLQRIPDSRKADWPLGEDVTSLGNGFWLCPPKTDSGERIVVLDDVMCGRWTNGSPYARKKAWTPPCCSSPAVARPSTGESSTSTGTRRYCESAS